MSFFFHVITTCKNNEYNSLFTMIHNFSIRNITVLYSLVN